MEKNWSCYGKKLNCREVCAYKEACKSNYRDTQEDWRNRTFKDGEFHEDVVDPDKIEEEKEEIPETSGFDNWFELKKLLHIIREMDIPEEERGALMFLAKSRSKQIDADERIREVVRTLGEVYLYDRTGFEVMVSRYLAGGSLASVAKSTGEGITRQAVWKRMNNGASRIRKYREMVKNGGNRLSGVECAVLNLAVVEGKHRSEIAEILGVGRATVWRVFERLSKRGIAVKRKIRMKH